MSLRKARAAVSSAATSAYQNVTTINNQSKEIFKNDYERSQSVRKQVNEFFKDNETDLTIKANRIGYFIAGAIIAIPLFALTFNVFWNSRLLNNPCYNNCNYPHGYCNTENVCICTSPVHSGRSCQFSACGVCSHNSTCAPYLMAKNIIYFCKWENPSPSNLKDTIYPF